MTFSNIRIVIAAFVCALATGLPFASAQTAPVYRVDELGFLDGGTSLVGVAMNANGDVAGYATDANGVAHAIRWTEAGGLEDLGLNGGTQSIASAINHGGDVVGSYWDQDGVSHPFIAPRGGRMTDLTPRYPEILELTAISNNGRLAGSTVNFNAFRTEIDGTLRVLTSRITEAFAINDDGMVAGSLWPDASMSVPGNAFRYSDAEGLVDLGTISGGWSAARAINRTGVVVGWSGGTDTLLPHAFRAAPGQPMQDLGVVPGGFLGGISGATAINDAGEVVGYADGESTETPFLFTDAGGMINLRGVLPAADADRLLLDTATAINGAHQITATFFDPSGATYSTVRLTPIAPAVAGPVLSPTVDVPFLIPANRRMVTVTVDPHVVDANDPRPSCAITRVVDSAQWWRGYDPDVRIVGALRVSLRAEHAPLGFDRIYRITVACSDRFGKKSQADVNVVVPHEDRRWDRNRWNGRGWLPWW